MSLIVSYVRSVKGKEVMAGSTSINVAFVIYTRDEAHASKCSNNFYMDSCTSHPEYSKLGGSGLDLVPAT